MAYLLENGKEMANLMAMESPSMPQERDMKGSGGTTKGMDGESCGGPARWPMWEGPRMNGKLGRDMKEDGRTDIVMGKASSMGGMARYVMPFGPKMPFYR